MSKSDLARMGCSVARSIELVGDQWTQMILRELFLGSRRYEQFLRHTQISPHLLSKRLKRMEDEGILKRNRYSDHRNRFEYKLTEKGRDLWPVIIAFKAWGDKWLDNSHSTQEVTISHAKCGHVGTPHLVCSGCGDPIHAVTAIANMSPEMQAERQSLLPSQKGPLVQNRAGRRDKD